MEKRNSLRYTSKHRRCTPTALVRSITETFKGLGLSQQPAFCPQKTMLAGTQHRYSASRLVTTRKQNPGGDNPSGQSEVTPPVVTPALPSPMTEMVSELPRQLTVSSMSITTAVVSC